MRGAGSFHPKCPWVREGCHNLPPSSLEPRKPPGPGPIEGSSAEQPPAPTVRHSALGPAWTEKRPCSRVSKHGSWRLLHCSMRHMLSTFQCLVCCILTSVLQGRYNHLQMGKRVCKDKPPLWHHTMANARTRVWIHADRWRCFVVNSNSCLCTPGTCGWGHTLEKKAVTWVVFHKENRLNIEKYKE